MDVVQGLVAAVVVGLLVCGVSGAQEKREYPAPEPVKDESVLGVGIQRTMTLLATSTPQRRNKVRILFYGQSITVQDWSRQVAEELRRRFPHADLEIENRAIGGFAAQALIRPAEHDLYPFYPDLLIFHVYGANQQYEQIIQRVRSRTTAEVLMQRDHVAAQWPATQPDEQDKGLWWDHMMNNVFLPAIARKYQCALVDVRGGWLEYVRSNGYEPRQLLSDDVHLNDQGNHLMAQLVGRYLVYRPDLPQDGWKDLVRTYDVGKDVEWEGGKLALEFEGNRVDVIPARDSDGAGPVGEVLIDGKKPSQFPQCYYIPRPQPGPWSPLAVSRVDHGVPLVLEDWTLTITSVSEDSRKWTFKVSGSVTGDDGEGDSDKLFVSRSGRVRIDPEAWFRHGTVPAGYQIQWTVRPLFADEYRAPQVADPSRDNATTLAQGLSNGRHRLEIVARDGGTLPIEAIRVYRPPFEPEAPASATRETAAR